MGGFHDRMPPTSRLSHPLGPGNARFGPEGLNLGRQSHC
jgi:hypothetical protein